GHRVDEPDFDVLRIRGWCLAPRHRHRDGVPDAACRNRRRRESALARVIGGRIPTVARRGLCRRRNRRGHYRRFARRALCDCTRCNHHGVVGTGRGAAHARNVATIPGNAPNIRTETTMNGMDGMGWGTSLISLLVLILVVLGILALVKYLAGRR